MSVLSVHCPCLRTCPKPAEALCQTLANLISSGVSIWMSRAVAVFAGTAVDWARGHLCANMR